MGSGTQAAQRPNPFGVIWGIRDPLYVIALTYFSLIFLGAATYVSVGGLFGLRQLLSPGAGLSPEVMTAQVNALFSSPLAQDLVLVVQDILTVFFLNRFILKRYPLRWGDFIRPGQVAADVNSALRMLLFALVLVAGAVTLVVIGIELAGRVVSMDASPMVMGYLNGLEEEAHYVMTPGLSVLRLGIVILIAPPLEEFLFRGLLYAALRKRFGVFPSILLSSCVFTLNHTQLAFGLPNILIIGCICAYLYETTRSLRAPILFHGLWNVFSTTGEFPLIWVFLLPVLGWLIWFGRRQGRARSGRPRTWWRVYAVVFSAVTVLLYAADTFSGQGGADPFWMVLLELPACAAVTLYAWNKRVGSTAFWRTYIAIYLLWTFGRGVLWAAMAGSGVWEWGILLVQFVLQVFLPALVFVFPALLAAWRLSEVEV